MSSFAIYNIIIIICSGAIVRKRVTFGDFEGKKILRAYTVHKGCCYNYLFIYVEWPIIIVVRVCLGRTIICHLCPFLSSKIRVMKLPHQHKL